MHEFVNYKTLALAAVWILIFVRGSHTRAYRHYPAFYWYVGMVAGSVLVSIAAGLFWGLSSTVYAWVFTFAEIGGQLGYAVFLVWLILLPKKLRWSWLSLVMTACLSIAIAPELLLTPKSSLVLQILRSGRFFLFLLAGLAIYRCLTTEGFRLGRNMSFAVGAMFVKLAVEVLNANSYMIQFWDYAVSNNFFDFVGIASWGVTAWGMWDLDLPKRKD